MTVATNIMSTEKKVLCANSISNDESAFPKKVRAIVDTLLALALSVRMCLCLRMKIAFMATHIKHGNSEEECCRIRRTPCVFNMSSLKTL